MSSADHTKARGGARPGAGRRKSERPVDGNVARKIKTKIRAEQTWVSLILIEQRKLGISADGTLADPKAFSIASTTPLANMLKYLDDRDLGRPVDTVNHLHDKPIEMNVKVSYFEAIERARKRAADKA